MSATLAEANDAILALFKTAWDTTGFTAVYENVKADIPTGTAPWSRITLRHAIGGLGALTGALGTSRYDREGFLIVQIFVPLGEGLSEGYSLGKVVLDAFEGQTTTNGVWFRNSRINEVGPDGEWYQFNVTIDFSYDEIK